MYMYVIGLLHDDYFSNDYQYFMKYLNKVILESAYYTLCTYLAHLSSTHVHVMFIV